MRERKKNVGGGEEEFHSDSECKLVVEDGRWRERGRQWRGKETGGCT